MFTQDKTIAKNLCFILMPFGDEMVPIYNKIKEIIADDHKLICLRADDIYSAGIVIQEVWDNIQKAQIIVADITDKNPNVFYEMGLAHAINKNIIIIAQKEDDVPFDLRHLRVIIYDKNRLEDFGVKLSKSIERLKWQPFEIIQWLTTDKNEVRIGLSTPIDQMTMNKTPIESMGRVVGLPNTDLNFRIQGFVITDKIYDQGSTMIDNNGYWVIREIHLGGTKDKLFFEIFDEAGRRVAKSEDILIYLK